MNKVLELKKIAEEIEQCSECKVGTSGKAVVGEGNPNATIMFVGEAPGKQEALSGRPFIGRSGKFLRSQIREIGLSEEDVYITSPVKYLPDRGTPSPSQIAHGKIHFDKQVAIINSQIIVMMGSIAIQGVLGEKILVSKKHGSVIEKNKKSYFISYHPAAAIRFAKLRDTFKNDFSILKKIALKY